MLAIEPGDAQVIAACVAAFATILVAVIGVQRKVHRDNRADHMETAAKVDRLLVGQQEIIADVRDVKADVRDLRATAREHDGRLDNLEHPQWPRGAA